jgi:Fe-S cluster assembly protein SufB
MSTATNTTEDLVNREYKYGFITDIETDTVPRGLNEDIIRLISAKKNEPSFMLDWRLKAYRHWVKLAKSHAEPKWANIHYPPIDYQDLIYYSAPKTSAEGLKSLDEVDPKLLETYEKLGIPLSEQKSRSMRSLTAFLWRRHSRKSWGRWGSSFVPFPRRCRSMQF